MLDFATYRTVIQFCHSIFQSTRFSSVMYQSISNFKETKFKKDRLLINHYNNKQQIPITSGPYKRNPQ